MRILSLLSALAFAGTAAAQLPPLPSSMNDDACNVTIAFDHAIMSQINSHSNRRDLMMANIEALQEILTAREYEDDIPVGDQMTADEAVKFQELSQKVASAQVVELIESKRERDMWAIRGMAYLTDDASDSDFDLEALPEKDKVYLAFAMSAHELITLPDGYEQQIPPQGGCTLENALYAESQRAIESMESVYGWEDAFADVEILMQKYGGLDADVMNEPDRLKFERDIMPVLNELNMRSDRSQIFYKIALLENMSKVRYRAMQMDQYEAPGDIEYMGTNWQRMVDENGLSENETIAAQVLYQLDEVVPASVLEAWEQITGSDE